MKWCFLWCILSLPLSIHALPSSSSGSRKMSTDSCPPRKRHWVLWFVADIKPIITSNAVRDKMMLPLGYQASKSRSQKQVWCIYVYAQISSHWCRSRVGGAHTSHWPYTCSSSLSMSSRQRWLDFKHSPKSTKRSCSGKGPCRIRFLFYSFGLQNLLWGTWFIYFF